MQLNQTCFFIAILKHKDEKKIQSTCRAREMERGFEARPHKYKANLQHHRSSFGCVGVLC
jgi:hypothetical protein